MLIIVIMFLATCVLERSGDLDSDSSGFGY